MPPNTASPAASQPTPSSSQASIRSYMRPGGTIRRMVRDTVNSVLAIPDGAQGEDPGMEVESEDNEERRKRVREEEEEELMNSVDWNDESIMGTDQTHRDLSDSLIANTSIDGARRRRISAVSETPEDASPTVGDNIPAHSIAQQMEVISEVTNEFCNDTPDIEFVQHSAGSNGRSAQTNRSSTIAMMNGISSLTNQVISASGHGIGAPTQTLEWDHEGLPPTYPPISPRPVPTIQETQSQNDNQTDT